MRPFYNDFTKVMAGVEVAVSLWKLRVRLVPHHHTSSPVDTLRSCFSAGHHGWGMYSYKPPGIKTLFADGNRKRRMAFEILCLLTIKCIS